MTSATKTPHRTFADLATLEDRDAIAAALDDAKSLGCDAAILAVALPIAPPRGKGRADARAESPVALATRRELDVLVDIDLRSVPADAPIVAQHPGWFRRPPVDPDPRVDPSTRELPSDAIAHARADAGDAFVDWWVERLEAVARAGVFGVRFVHASRLRPLTLRGIVERLRSRSVPLWLAIDTLGAAPADVMALDGIDFDAAFSSLAWWNGVSSWWP